MSLFRGGGGLTGYILKGRPVLSKGRMNSSALRLTLSKPLVLAGCSASPPRTLGPGHTGALMHVLGHGCMKISITVLLMTDLGGEETAKDRLKTRSLNCFCRCHSLQLNGTGNLCK